MKKAIVIGFGVLVVMAGILAIVAHLAEATKLALYGQDYDDEDIY